MPNTEEDLLQRIALLANRIELLKRIEKSRPAPNDEAPALHCPSKKLSRTG